MPSPPSEVTALLRAWSRGDHDARDRLMPLVFEDLRVIARQQLVKERRNHTLDPTALVHELYLRLVGQEKVAWRDRNNFFAVSATLIRRVLVDHARRRRAAKRGSDGLRVTLDSALRLADGEGEDTDLLALDDALDALKAVTPRGSRIVELHIFTGLGHQEIADVLEISRSTVIRDWNHAKLWLRRAMRAP